jgi:hypothetical protein
MKEQWLNIWQHSQIAGSSIKNIIADRTCWSHTIQNGINFVQFSTEEAFGEHTPIGSEKVPVTR